MSGQIYGVLSDIHGNLEALQAVFEDAAKAGVTDFVCVGDIVGYNANPAECLDKIRELNCVAVRGNHDHYCSFDDDLTGFHPWRLMQWIGHGDNCRPISKNTWRICRWCNGLVGLLSSIVRWICRICGYVFEGLEAESSFNYQTTTICFFGHTHVPLAFEKASEVVGGTTAA